MNITILNYTGNESNWGCQATSNNILQLLKKSNDEELLFSFIEIEYQGSKIRRLFNRTRIKTINLILAYTVFLTNFSKMFHPLEAENIKKIKECDLLILNGEGSLHGCNVELIKFVQYLSYAKKIGKKTAIINHSLQFDNKKAKKYLENLYTYSDINYFREELSLNNSHQINVKNSFLVPDAAFLNYEIDTSYLMIEGIPLKYIASSGSVVLKEDNRKYFDLLYKLGKYFNLPIVFIASCAVDKSFKELVTKEYEFTYYDETQLSVAQVQKAIKESEFFYSGRFHLNIFSATVGKIFIPFISNTVKMQGFLNLIGYPIKEIGVKNIEIEKEYENIISFIENNKALKNILLNNSKKQVKVLYKKYQELLK
jgi:polysaccharide pyruvyl transferase WcaK-like protein